VSVDAVEVRTTGDIARALEALARTPGAGLIGMPDPFVYAYRALAMDPAARNRIPAVYGFRNMAIEGGLMSYGVDIVDSDRRSATYVDRILRGVAPGERRSSLSWSCRRFRLYATAWRHAAGGE
jgi:putative ABC transport system substrate-binding protein